MTTSPAARYGSLAPPEERTRIEVVENPVTLARAAHHIWHPAASKLIRDNEYAWLPIDGMCERIYRLAHDQLAACAKAFAHVKPAELEAIISTIDARDRRTKGAMRYTPGLFLSALLNATELRELDGVFKYWVLGYRLAPGKAIIARPGSDMTVLGYHSRGTIINHGNARYMGDDASGGLQVNFGTVEESMAGDSSGDGVHINFGRARLLASKASGGTCINYGAVHDKEHYYALSWHVTGGIQVNLGKTSDMAEYAHGGMQANLGLVRGTFAKGADRGVQVNYGEVRKSMAHEAYSGLQANRGTAGENHCLHRGRMRTRRANAILDALEERLRRIEHLGMYRKDPERALACIRAYDWQAFTEDILRAGRKLRRAR
jgi:hypothetical protein